MRNRPAPTPSTLDSGLGDKGGVSRPNQAVAAVRRQAAAPPIYLLVLAVVPFFGSIFIAGSRWWDFRHHGFDILFGYLIGTVTAIYSFRYYHLPISSGAGWAWGPRSHDKAFWAGVGSFSYATDHLRGHYRAGDEEEALGVSDASDPFGRGVAVSNSSTPPPAEGGRVAPRKGQGQAHGQGRPVPDGRDEDTAYMGASAI